LKRYGKADRVLISEIPKEISEMFGIFWHNV